MYLGNYSLKLGTDGRVNIKKISRKMDYFVMSACKDGCLILRPSAEGEKCRKLKSGRLLIPVRFRKKAGLSRDIILAGCGDYLEIWDKNKWESQKKEVLFA